jgi:hypothetical protein
MPVLSKFYHISKHGIICDPSISGNSKRTKDIRFFEFANNYELQDKLGFITTFLLDPSHWCDKPKKGQELYEGVAAYISAFKPEEEQKLVYDHLMTNPIIKVIIN